LSKPEPYISCNALEDEDEEEEEEELYAEQKKHMLFE